MSVQSDDGRLNELLGRARVLMAQIHDLTSWEHRHLCELAPCQSAQWLLDAAIAAGPPAEEMTDAEWRPFADSLGIDPVPTAREVALATLAYGAGAIGVQPFDLARRWDEGGQP